MWQLLLLVRASHWHSLIKPWDFYNLCVSNYHPTNSKCTNSKWPNMDSYFWELKFDFLKLSKNLWCNSFSKCISNLQIILFSLSQFLWCSQKSSWRLLWIQSSVHLWLLLHRSESIGCSWVQPVASTPPWCRERGRVGPNREDLSMSARGAHVGLLAPRSGIEPVSPWRLVKWLRRQILNQWTVR